VFAQHEGQKQIMQKRGIKSVVFPNLIDLALIPPVDNPGHDYFLYVGWIDKRKGFSDFYKLVKNSPEHAFKVIGPPRDDEGLYYYEKLRPLKNVTLLGKLDHSETLQYIASSKALISTSQMEGFPNIFIEAWASGIPVLSLKVDPGNIIKKERLGVTANGDVNYLIKAINTFTYTRDFAERAKKYVERTHVLNDNKIKEINKLFIDLCDNQKIKVDKINKGELNEFPEKLINLN
jgi:glycosyltransferase involved in cell wall biosynthesis